jgi:hypothetical protein
MGFWGMSPTSLETSPLRGWRLTSAQTDKNEDSYQQVYQNDNFEENKSSFGHELIAGGAAFAGFKAFEDHQRAEGPSNTYRTQVPIANSAYRQARLPPIRKGIARWLRRSWSTYCSQATGTTTWTNHIVQVDKLAETKGEDWFDREKAKRQAKEHAERMYDEHYVDNQGASQYDPNQYGPPQHFERRGW